MGLGIIGTMEMARNAMRTARAGAEVSGNNLANAANPAYARQRVKISSSITIPTDKGPQGSGAEVSRLEHLRDKVLDKTIISEKSITEYLAAKQGFLRRAEASLGQTIDNQSIDPNSSSHGVSEGMNELFNSFQALSAAPTSTAERQTVIFNAQKISDKFNTIDRRLSDLRTSINAEVEDHIDAVNSRLKEVAVIAVNLGNIEILDGSANQVRDSLQSNLEGLAEFVNISTTTNNDGELSLFIDGVQMISDNVQIDSAMPHTDSNGMHFIAANNSGNVINLKSGYLKGLMDARDSSIANLKTKVNTLATQLITEVNALHRGGYDLDGNTGQDLFTGTGASDIGANANIVSDPRQLQGSSSATESGNNDVLRDIAALSTTTLTGLTGMTFNEYYGNTVSRFGQDISLTTAQLDDQRTVQKMMESQRESVMGVSVDEEIANLVVYQRAFQASAKLLTTMDGLMRDILNLSR